MEVGVRRFFLQDNVERAVEGLGVAPRLMILTGAGTSAEVGLPVWADLVNDMLAEVLEERFGEHASALRERVTGEKGRDNLLAAAETVVALLENEEELADLIREHLYQGDDPDQMVPGELARAVARLQRVAGDRLVLSTLNYDRLVEQALRAEGYSASSIRSYVRSRAPENMAAGVEAPVFHLHGLITADDAKQAVLTESDYQRMQAGSASWQERWVVDCLETRTCLFLGSSMADPNLLRWLYKHRQVADNPRHYAAFTRDESLAGSPALRDDFEAMDRARWLRVGVVPLYADHRADIAQFVHEVALRRKQGDAYRPFVERLDNWLDNRANGGMLTADPDVFPAVQAALSGQLAALLDVVRADLRSADVESDEVWQLTLWSRFPPQDEQENERVVAVGHSDRIMTDPATVESVELDVKDWVSIQALRTGMPVTDRPDTYASRWRYVRAIPIFAQPRLPVGSMSIASTTPDSVLDALPDVAARSLDRLLADAGLALLEARAD